MTAASVLQGRRILVVEDDYMVACHVAELLEAAGVVVAGPIGQLDEALAFVARHGTELDGAVLDINLHGTPSYPVADALARQGVGFVFATGYGAEALAPAYRDCPRCEKPLQAEALLAALARQRPAAGVAGTGRPAP